MGVVGKQQAQGVAARRQVEQGARLALAEVAVRVGERDGGGVVARQRVSIRMWWCPDCSRGLPAGITPMPRTPNSTQKGERTESPDLRLLKCTAMARAAGPRACARRCAPASSGAPAGLPAGAQPSPSGAGRPERVLHSASCGLLTSGRTLGLWVGRGGWSGMAAIHAMTMPPVIALTAFVDATAFAIAVLAAQRRLACAALLLLAACASGPAPRQTEPAVQPTLTLPLADPAPVPPSPRQSRPAWPGAGRRRRAVLPTSA